MATNAQIKLVRSLSEKKFRDSHSLFVVEGEKMVQEALRSGYIVEQVFSAEKDGEQALSRMSHLSTPPSCLALVRIPQADLSEDIPSELCLALDGVRDPGNLGTIIRLADWFGVNTIYCASPGSVDAFNPKVVQATMGSIFRVRLVYTDLGSLCARFIEKGLPVYGTLLDGENIYTSSLRGEGLLVMGNESRGLSEGIRSLVSDSLRIPSFGRSGAESLNVACACAIALSEFRRR